MDTVNPEMIETTQNEKTLIDRLEEGYKSALHSIDHDVEELIQNGKEMKGILLFSEKMSSILEIHEALHAFYALIFDSQWLLIRFNSERIKQLGYEPVATYELLAEILKDHDTTPENIEYSVISELEKVGFKKTHWCIKTRILAEIEYMIEALRILIEPEFIPLESEDNSSEDKPDRYIPSSVKLSVWRRDQGKCVECGSKEKLEYDHIIPVSTGGSNTERNIQLLCEKCNRKKSANIQ